MDRLGSWQEDAPLKRRSVWVPAVVTVVCVLLMPLVHHGELRAMLVVVAVAAAVRSSTAELILRLTRHMSPVEEAWRVGYETGYEDGQSVETVERRRVPDRRVTDRRGERRLRSVDDCEG